MKIQVYRTNASSYHDSQYIKTEASMLEKIEGITYLYSLVDADRDIPFILISNTKTELSNIPKKVLEKTVLLIHPNSGHENLESDILKEYSFPVVVGNEIRANAVAEFILSAIFKHLTEITNHTVWENDKIWNRKLLRDQKILILGEGHIGSIIKKSLTPLVPSLNSFDPKNNISLDLELFNQVDILILCCDLNKDNYEFINKNVLSQLKTDSLIINPARGELINQKDLLAHLRFNPKSFAYIDVFHNEPFNPNDFINFKNLNKTSHIAGSYKNLKTDTINFEYFIINDFISSYRGHDLSNFNFEYKSSIINRPLIGGPDGNIQQ